MKIGVMQKRVVAEVAFILSPAIIPLFLVSALNNLPTSPYAAVIGSLTSLLLIFAVLLKVDDKTLLVLRGVLIGLLYLFWLKGSLFSFEGFFWDSRYLALAVERFYHAFLPHSHEYRNIHFSMPPLYFFLIGKAGAMLKASLPAVLKYSGYLFVVYLPYLWGYGLKGMLKQDRWYGAFVLSLLIPFKTYESWYGALGTIAQKGWHFIGIFLIIIWYLWVRRKSPHFLLAGLLAGLVFAFDYYAFLPLFLAILLEIGTEVWPNSNGKAAFRRFLYYAKTGVVVIGVNLIWILPVILDLFRHPLGTSYNDWFHISGADILNVFGFFKPFDIFSLVFIAGFLNLFVNWSKSREIPHLRTWLFSLLVFGLIIYFLSFIPFTFLFADYSLLLIHILSLSCVFLLLHLGRGKSLPIVLLLIISSISALNQTEENTNLWNSSRISSHRYRVSTPLREQSDFNEAIIFPYTNELFYGENTFSFISPTITYSDPAGSFEKRLEYVRELAALAKKNETREFHARIKHTPFGDIEHVMLKKADQPGRLYFDLKIYMNDLKYPDKQGSKRDVFFYFETEDFPVEYFTRIYADDEFVVFRLK